MATPNQNPITKGRKDYNAAFDATDIDTKRAKILASDKYNSIVFDTQAAGMLDWDLGADPVNPTSAVMVGNDLLITFGYNDGADNVTKEVLVEGYMKNGKVSNPIKYINFVDEMGEFTQFNLSDYATGNALDEYNAKGVKLTGSTMGDEIDLTGAPGVNGKGYTINAGLGDDVIEGSELNDTIIGGKGDNKIIVNVEEQKGDDIITLTKGENLTIQLVNNADDLDMTDGEGYLMFGWTKNGVFDPVNGKDLTIWVFDDTALPHAGAPTGSLTVKNYKNYAAADSITFIDQSGNDFDVYEEFINEVDLAADDKKFVGTWLNDDIDATLVNPATKLTISAGDGDNDIEGHDGIDIVKAGKGNDDVVATNGDDTYTLGAGVNSITYDGTETGKDTITLTKGEFLTLDLSASVVTADLTTDGGILSFNKNDLVIDLGVGAKTIVVKNFRTVDGTGADGELYIQTGDALLPISLDEAGVNVFVTESNAKAIAGTWLDDTITSTAAGTKVTINAGDGDNVIRTSANLTDDVVKAGKGDDIYFASEGNDTITLGAGENTYTALLGESAGKDTIILTKGEILTIDGLGDLEDNKISISYDKNDLVIKSASDPAEFKEIVIKNFKSNVNGEVFLVTDDSPGDGYDLRAPETAEIFADGMVEVMAAGAKGYAGTNSGNVVDAANAAANASIKTLGGDDVIYAGANPIKVVGGAGVNTLKVTSSQEFGEVKYTLTKSEDLRIQIADAAWAAIDGNEEDYFEITRADNKKDLLITFKNPDSGEDTGIVRLVNFITADATGDLGSINIYGDDVTDGTVGTIKDFITGTYDLELAPVNNVFKGTWVDDVAVGTANNEKVILGKGNNTFVYEDGGHADEITLTKGEDLKILYNKDTGDVAFDTLFTVRRENKDLILESVTNPATDSIRIKNAAAGTSTNTILLETADGFQFDVLDPETAQVAEQVAIKNGKGTLTGSQLNETLVGTNATDDVIKAVGGTNTINGMQGNDKLYGGTGEDTFVFNIGDGSDEVYNGTSADYVKLVGAGVNGAKLTRVNNDLLIQGKIGAAVQDGVVTLKNYFTSNNRIEEILDAGGNTIVRISEALAAGNVTTAGAGVINGTEQNDIIDASASDRKNTINLYGGIDEVVLGGHGDTVKGTSGAKTITGGEGNDTITGGLSETIYNYARGGGKDTINLTRGEALIINWTDLYIDVDIDSQEVFDQYFTVTRNGNNVTISRIGLQDSITINNLTTANFAEEVILRVTGDGGLCTYSPQFIDPDPGHEYVIAYGDPAATKAQNIVGTVFDDKLVGGLGNDTITTLDGDDVMIGNQGNDTFTVNGEGEKEIQIGRNDGNDTVKFTANASDWATTIKFTGNDIDAPEDYKMEIVNGKDLVVSTETNDPGVMKETRIVDYVTNESKIDDIVDEDDDSLIPVQFDVRANGKQYLGSRLDENFEGTAASGEVFTTGAGIDDIATGGGKDTINVNGAGTKTITITPGGGDTTINITGDALIPEIGNAIDVDVTGVAAGAFELSRSGNNLVATYEYDAGKFEKVTFVNYFKNFSANDEDFDHVPNVTLKGGAIDPQADLINITTGFKGTLFNEQFIGTAKADNITTGEGVDVVVGNGGDDKITIDNQGNKRIVINAGDGDDTIIPYENVNPALVGTVTLDFGELGVATVGNPVYSSPDGEDLVVTVTRPGGTMQNVTIQGYFSWSGDAAGKLMVNGMANSVMAQLNEPGALILSDFSDSRRAMTYEDTPYDDFVTGSNYADTFTAGREGHDAIVPVEANLGDRLTPGKGNDDVFIQGGGKVTVSIAKEDGNDTISYVDGNTYSPNAENKIVIGADEGAAATFDYNKNGDNLVITRKYNGEAAGTTTVENYFTGTDGMTAPELAAYQHMKLEAQGVGGATDEIDDRIATAGGVTVDGTKVGHDTVFTGSRFVDNITGSTGHDFVGELGEGEDVITLGKGDATIDLTDSEDEKTIIINRKDGATTTTIICDVAGSAADFANLHFNDDTPEPPADATITYSRAGNDLTIHATYEDKLDVHGNVVAKGVVQLVTLVGYFTDDEPAAIIDSKAKITLNEDALGAYFVDGTDFTNANFVTDTGASFGFGESILGLTADQEVLFDVINPYKGDDIIYPFDGNNVINLNTDEEEALPVDKRIVLSRAPEGKANNTLIATGAEYQADPDDLNHVITLDYGVFNADKGDTMEFERVGDGLTITTNYTKDGVLIKGQNVVSVIDFFNKSGTEDANNFMVYHEATNTVPYYENLSTTIGTVNQVKYAGTLLDTDIDLMNHAYDATITVSEDHANALTTDDYNDKVTVTVEEESNGHSVDLGAGNNKFTATLGEDSDIAVSAGAGNDSYTITSGLTGLTTITDLGGTNTLEIKNVQGQPRFLFDVKYDGVLEHGVLVDNADLAIVSEDQFEAFQGADIDNGVIVDNFVNHGMATYTINGKALEHAYVRKFADTVALHLGITLDDIQDTYANTDSAFEFLTFADAGEAGLAGYDAMSDEDKEAANLVLVGQQNLLKAQMIDCTDYVLDPALYTTESGVIHDTINNDFIYTNTDAATTVKLSKGGEDLVIAEGAGRGTYEVSNAAYATISDAAGADEYNINLQGSGYVQVGDIAGNDEYDVVMQGTSEVIINDAAGNDDYSLKLIDENTDALIYDKLGSDDYTIKAGVGDIEINDGQALEAFVDGQQGDTYAVEDGFKGTLVIKDLTTLGAAGEAANDTYAIGGTNGATITVNDASGNDLYAVSAAEGVAVTITDSGDGNDTYMASTTADLTINDEDGINALYIHDKDLDHDDIEITLKLTKGVGNDHYTSELLIGGIKITNAVGNVTDATIVADLDQRFGLADNGEFEQHVITAEQLNTLIQGVDGAAGTWTVTNGDVSGTAAFGALFDTGVAQYDTAQVTVTWGLA